MPDNEKPAGKKYPGGTHGFLVRLRENGVAAALPGKQFKVIIMLYSRRNKEGIAWPSYACLARDAGVSYHTVRRAIEWAKISLRVLAERNQGRIKKAPKNAMIYYLPLNPTKCPSIGHFSRRKHGRQPYDEGIIE